MSGHYVGEGGQKNNSIVLKSRIALNLAKVLYLHFVRHEILSLKVPNVELDFDVPDDISMLGFRH